VIRLLLFDPDLRALIAREHIFQHQEGCQIVQASDVDEFIRLARQSRPHVVIADGDLLGTELEPTLAQLKRSAALRGTPIFVTAAPKMGMEERLLKAGADAVLGKPVGKQRFYELIRGAGAALQMEVRVPVAVDVAYTVGARERRGRVANLSKGGLYLEADSPSPVGAKVTIHLALPTFTNTIQVNGVVSWVNGGQSAKLTHLPRGMGVRFVETPLVALKTVALYVLLSKTVLRIT
jgi:uncharacterized protein (TIGR02266 family)